MKRINDENLTDQIEGLHKKLNPGADNPGSFISIWANTVKRITGIKIQRNNISHMLINDSPLIFTYIVVSDGDIPLKIDLDNLQISQRMSGECVGAIAMMLTYVMLESDKNLDFDFMETQLSQFYNFLRLDEEIGEIVVKMWNFNNTMEANNVEKEEETIDISDFMNAKYD